jgi:hypothetical protein
MKAHKCVPIVMQIGLAICMTANPHQVMFFYQEMVLSIGIAKTNLLILCYQHKLNIWQLNKQQNKQCGFHHFLEALVFHK